ncbi:MAG: ribonuclease P protein component [Alphaproteobacteria bacterium]|nr:ribonuclease P protein component [Alphaproteobacteria bacterium]
MDDHDTTSRTGPAAGPCRLLTLKARADFLAAAKGVRAHRPNLSLQRRDRRDSEPAARVGFTVTKKEGGSVERNRIRRRLRAAVREVLPEFGAPGADYVLIGRRAALDSPFQSLVQDLKEALAEAARRAAKGAKPPRPTNSQAESSAPDGSQR